MLQFSCDGIRSPFGMIQLFIVRTLLYNIHIVNALCATRSPLIVRSSVQLMMVSSMPELLALAYFYCKFSFGVTPFAER